MSYVSCLPGNLGPCTPPSGLKSALRCCSLHLHATSVRCSPCACPPALPLGSPRRAAATPSALALASARAERAWPLCLCGKAERCAERSRAPRWRVKVWCAVARSGFARSHERSTQDVAGDAWRQLKARLALVCSGACMHQCAVLAPHPLSDWLAPLFVFGSWAVLCRGSPVELKGGSGLQNAYREPTREHAPSLNSVRVRTASADCGLRMASPEYCGSECGLRVRTADCGRGIRSTVGPSADRECGLRTADGVSGAGSG